MVFCFFRCQKLSPKHLGDRGRQISELDATSALQRVPPRYLHKRNPTDLRGKRDSGRRL